MLPSRDGFQVLQDMRVKQDQTPVLILTARDAVEDRAAGLDLGADDYLVKPSAFAELLARLRAITRCGRSEDTLRFVVGDLELDLATRTVRRAGHCVKV